MSQSNPRPPVFSSERKLRLGHFVTHPIQYFAPLYRRLAQEPDLELTVVYHSDLSVRREGYRDTGFGVDVKWDIPLLEGYRHEFLPVLREKGPLGFFNPLNGGVERAVRRHGFDALWLHGYASLTNLRAARVARRLQAPVFIRTDSSLFDRERSGARLWAKQRFFDWLRPQLAGALAIGKGNADYWRKHLGADFPVFDCRFAVDNEFFQQRCREAAVGRELLRHSLGLEPGRPVILFAAKFIARKRAADLIAAYFEFRRAGMGPAPYLLLIGDGPERASLEQMAQGSADIRFLGFRNQTELPAFYDLCDVFVLASVDEPWGLSINEAMNAGRAVIVSDRVGCGPDLVEEGRNGAVARAGDLADLAAALGRVLKAEPVWRAMGQASLCRIADYSFEQNVRGIRQALAATVPGFLA